MTELIKTIREQVGCNEPATVLQISMYNAKLKQAGLPDLPANYAALLQQANGFSNEGHLVFGAEVKNNNWFKDIVTYNLRYFGSEKAQWLILGADDWFYFIYNKEKNKYCVVDQDSFEPEVESDSFEEPLSWILNVDSN